MSFMEITHTNPGRVTKRLERWNEIFGTNNLLLKTIETQMDIAYEAVVRDAPVRTGYLRSTVYTKSGPDFAQIGVTAYYAYYVSEGKGGAGRKTRVANPFWKVNIASLSIETIMVVRNLFQGNF